MRPKSTNLRNIQKYEILKKSISEIIGRTKFIKQSNRGEFSFIFYLNISFHKIVSKILAKNRF